MGIPKLYLIVRAQNEHLFHGTHFLDLVHNIELEDEPSTTWLPVRCCG